MTWVVVVVRSTEVLVYGIRALRASRKVLAFRSLLWSTLTSFLYQVLEEDMASVAGHRQPQCHVLNFFYDRHDDSALTVLVNNVRFHIIADATKLKAESGPGAKLTREYEQLLAAVKQEENAAITRPCSKQNLRTRGRDSNSHDSGHGTEDERDPEDERDSAVDVNSPSKKTSLLHQADDDPQKALNNWMLTPFGPIFDKHAPESAQQEELTVQGWYERPTMFFNLEIQNDELKATEEEATDELEKRMIDMTPKMYLPKYIRQMDIPWYPSKDVIVLEEGDEPAPYHPTRVRIGEETFFMKVVDPTQPSPTKREIDLLKKAQRLGLHEKIRVPLVKGLVGFQDSKIEIIGFLQTPIEDPTALTHMFDDEVPQRKRDKWAKESDRIKVVLHENGIVWGDAKADNFMVDKNDNLWIIDFGGSFTEGWVDPELMETVEGDNMGVDRIVNALHDPNANPQDGEKDKMMPYQPEEEKVLPSPSRFVTKGRKRKADEGAETSETIKSTEVSSRKGRSSPNKRSRKESAAKSDGTGNGDEDQTPKESGTKRPATPADEQDGEEQERYCFCNKPSSGDMVGCDNDDCRRQWFHFECVNLDSAPKSKRWFCDECKQSDRA